ncbi:hypothetical protein R5H30_00115 [Sulfitobacter sp. D35]|uniref:hypothetical protein n=1 Tax=Sulfitobacter sp. D35 TaxID=3083252 RepID=UPI00296F15F7|nr:hypothetical protein [Sulfitobacter sp. D35]MDW4496368.1 hypothetical protein [Sulfitobacter sp. D35]
MRSTLSVLLVSALLLPACNSNLNPVNWFGSSTPAPVTEPIEATNPLIPTRTGLFGSRRAEVAVYRGTPIDSITDLTIERVPGGAIVRASGISARQGVYDVRLTPANPEVAPVDGVLTFRLEGLRNPEVASQGTPASREVTAARKITDNTLRATHTIRVEGLQNARVSSR